MGIRNTVVDMYSNDTLPNTMNFPTDTCRAAGTSVSAFFDGTDEWVTSGGTARTAAHTNDLLADCFQGALS